MKIAVLICTKDRPDKLIKLLHSLEPSAYDIKQIVIVSSGQNVSDIIRQFANKLDITYLHVNTPGQILQKKAGIKLVDPSILWTLFLDDDVTVPIGAIDILIKEYLLNVKYIEVVGFGLKINGQKLKNFTNSQKFLLSLVGLYSNVPGSVLSSGHAQSYQSSNTDIATEWLNGISIWKTSCLSSYDPISSNIDYAAYEDVMFSYSISRKNQLIFASRVEVMNQQIENYRSLNYSQYRAGAYMRLLFIDKHNGFSKIRLLIAQISRGLMYINNGNYSDPFYKEIFRVNRIWFDIFFSMLIKRRLDDLVVLRFSKF